MPADTKRSQRERFGQAARELGVDLDEEKLREALRHIAPQRPHLKDDSKSDDDT